MLDEVKKVMNVLYHRLHSQFMPSMSYEGLQIRQIFMATIRVYAKNLFFVSFISFCTDYHDRGLPYLFLCVSPPTIFMQRV
jgi:hypothetical protein